MSGDFKTSELFLMGRNGEKIVAEELRRRGWWIIPSYDYSGEDGNKAPKLHGLTDDLVIPDLDVMKGGLRKWVEVKTKTQATFTYTAKRLDHGIDLRHWESYCKVKTLSGCPVWLAIYELDTSDVLIQDTEVLSSASRLQRFRQRGTVKPMIYFPRDAFRLLFNAAELPA